MCKNPYMSSSGLAYGCGQCNPCLFNRRRVWASRIMLEARQHSVNSFVTLTYSEEDRRANLCPSDLREFLWRLRAWYRYHHKSRFRFFAVGEYGEENEGAHYHLMLFGFPTCAYRRSRFGSNNGVSCCYICDAVRKVWGAGNVFLGEVEKDSAGYVCGYVTKRWTRDCEELKGRVPEFARMSLKPGIGGDAMFDVADMLLRYDGLIESMPDVPWSLRFGPKEQPLGRYLKRKLREYVGRDPGTPQMVFDELQAKMRPMLLAARADKENPSLKEKVIAAGEGQRARFEARRKIFREQRGLRK